MNMNNMVMKRKMSVLAARLFPNYQRAFEFVLLVVGDRQLFVGKQLWAQAFQMRGTLVVIVLPPIAAGADGREMKQSEKNPHLCGIKMWKVNEVTFTWVKQKFGMWKWQFPRLDNKKMASLLVSLIWPGRTFWPFDYQDLWFTKTYYKTKWLSFILWPQKRIQLAAYGKMSLSNDEAYSKFDE